MHRQVTDILEGFVNQLAFTQAITNLTDNADGTFTIDVCATYHVQPCFSRITIGAESYKVTDVVNNQSITFTAGAAPVGDSYTVAAPEYLHGTRVAINNEIDRRVKNNMSSFPLVFVWEVIREIFNLDFDTTIERESDLRIFFLGRRPDSVDKTDTLYDDAVIPMSNLAHEFVKLLQGNKCTFGELDGNYTLINYAKFGTESTNGATDSFFNPELSGVELRINLPILKDFTGMSACDC